MVTILFMEQHYSEHQAQHHEDKDYHNKLFELEEDLTGIHREMEEHYDDKDLVKYLEKAKHAVYAEMRECIRAMRKAKA